MADKKEDILEYSTDTNEKYYYICPKYWDLENDKVLSQIEVDSGSFGTIYSKGKGR